MTAHRSDERETNTFPVELPKFEIHEKGAFLREQIGGMTKDGVEINISRSPTGLTLFVSVKGSPKPIVVLDLRPVLTQMADVLLKARERGGEHEEAD